MLQLTNISSNSLKKSCIVTQEEDNREYQGNYFFIPGVYTVHLDLKFQLFKFLESELIYLHLHLHGGLLDDGTELL